MVKWQVGVARSVVAICIFATSTPSLLSAQIANLDLNTVVIDPAHGGLDAGARIAQQVAEKDVTLAVAEKLQALLLAQGFRVVMTRAGEADGGSLDRRAEVANRAHAIACLVIHASGSTSGVLIGTSALRSAVMRASSSAHEDLRTGVPWGIPWSRAQEVYLPQSGLLANQVGTAMARAGVPATMMRVMMRPLDNLTCPAISIEVGALVDEASRPTPMTDAGYQQRIAESIAASLQRWRKEAQPGDDPFGAGH